MSFTEQPNAWLTALTSGSEMGSVHATRLVPEGCPLKRVGLSFGMSSR